MKNLTSPVVSLLVLLATIAAGTILAALHVATPTWFSVVIGLVGGHAATAGGMKLLTPGSASTATVTAVTTATPAAKTTTTPAASAAAPVSGAA